MSVDLIRLGPAAWSRWRTPADDEVAVDFPATSPVFERALAAFGEAHASEGGATDVHLTPDEARRGRAVYVELVLDHLCGACGGRGETWAEDCDACSSTGCRPQSHVVRVPMPPGVREGARFRLRVHSRALTADFQLNVRVG
ncbi:MAG: hypothetical protein U0Q12_18980 [Vicinamibacterales bacterium]